MAVALRIVLQRVTSSYWEGERVQFGSAPLGRVPNRSSLQASVRTHLRCDDVGEVQLWMGYVVVRSLEQ